MLAEKTADKAENSGFAVTIHEGGKSELFRVSLYAVGPSYHKKILQWIKDSKINGLRIFPDDYRLDTTNFRL